MASVVVVLEGVSGIGGQQTIAVDPLNEHIFGILLFLIPCLAAGQLLTR